MDVLQGIPAWESVIADLSTAFLETGKITEDLLEVIVAPLDKPKKDITVREQETSSILSK